MRQHRERIRKGRSSCLTHLGNDDALLAGQRSRSKREVANESINDTLPVRPVPRFFDHPSNATFAYGKSYDRSEMAGYFSLGNNISAARSPTAETKRTGGNDNHRGGE